MRQERKVVTALFADTVGSTTMGERLDPEDVYELIGEALVRAIAAGEAFGGTVKDLAGDGALMLFGAPVSHEDDAERAVRAGLEIVRSIEQYAQQLRTRGIDGFSMRVGIETGLAVLGPVGGGGKVEYGAMGNALNTAARLQGLAEPGTVVVGPQTFERVAPNFAWGEPREVALKGKSEPVVVRVVQAVLRPSGSSRSLTGMTAAHVGRQAEMATAREAMSQLETGKGGVFLITGAAGVGKSRLVGEVRAAASNKIAWLEARSASYAQRTPYSVFRDLLVDALNATSGEDTIERVREQVGQQHADAVTPFAAVLAGVPDTGAQGRAAALSSATLQRGLVDVVRRVMDASRAGRPLVVVVEDLHWTDPSSLDLLGRVIDATTGSAILYVITTRLEAGQASTDFIGEATIRGARLVKLDPLPPGAAQELLTSLLGPGVLPGSVEQRLLDAAEGNPFYLEELVRSLRDAGALHRAEGGWILDDSAPLDVPPTVEQVILARLDRLSDVDREVVDAASVIGRSFDLELLVGVGGGVAAEIEASVANLERLDVFVRPAAVAGTRGEEYQFAHNLIQETAYRALVRGRRAALHLRVGRSLEPRATSHARLAGLVGRHYRAAGEPGAALDWLVAGAHEASKAQALDEALQAYEDALDAARETGLDPSTAFVASLRIDRGGLLARRGDPQVGRTELESALQDVRAGGEHGLECRVEAELGFVLAGAADNRAALMHLEASLRIAEERGDATARVTALARLSLVHTNMLRLDLGREFGERALSSARASGDEHLLSVALDAQKQVAVQLGDRAYLGVIADELETIHRSNDELWLLQFVLFERGYMAVGTARWEEADRRLREALEISRRIGDRGNELLHRSLLGWRDRCRGHHADALRTLEDVERGAHEIGHAEWSAWTSLLLGSTLLDLERPDAAAPHLKDAVATAEEGGALVHLVRAIAQLAWCSWLMDDHDDAADLAARAASILGDIVCPRGATYLSGADAYLATGRVLLALGDVAQAAALVGPVAEAGRRFGWIEASAGGAIVLGRCSEAMGQVEEAVNRFREAVAIAVDAGMVVLERDARAALASTLISTDPDEAGRQASAADEITVRLRGGMKDARLGEDVSGVALSRSNGE